MNTRTAGLRLDIRAWNGRIQIALRLRRQAITAHQGRNARAAAQGLRKNPSLTAHAANRAGRFIPDQPLRRGICGSEPGPARSASVKWFRRDGGFERHSYRCVGGAGLSLPGRGERLCGRSIGRTRRACDTGSDSVADRNHKCLAGGARLSCQPLQALFQRLFYAFAQMLLLPQCPGVPRNKVVCPRSCSQFSR